MTYYAALGALEQGLVYGIMVIGVYLTFRILDFPDLTVDGSLPLGAALSAVAITGGINPYLSLIDDTVFVVMHILYRILKRDDVTTLFAIDLIDNGSNRGRLSTSGRPCHQY